MSWKDVGYSLQNAGLEEEISEKIKKEHPSWNDKQVEKELRKQQKGMTIFGKHNKKSKKIKTDLIKQQKKTDFSISTTKPKKDK